MTCLTANDWDREYYDDHRLQINHYIKNDGVPEFHNFMQNMIQEITDPNKLIKIKNSIAIAIIYSRLDPYYKFLDILIGYYDYTISERIMNYILHNYYGVNIVPLLHKFNDITKLIDGIKYYFCKSCAHNDNIENDNIENLEEILNMGFDINQIAVITPDDPYGESALYHAILNSNTTILKFLLDKGILFEKYQLQILNTCIFFQRLNHLKIFVEYGLNFDFLKDYTHKSSLDVEMYKFFMEQNVDPMTIALLFTKR